MTRRITVFVVLACLGLAAAPAAAQTRVHRTPTPEPAPACDVAIDCRAELAGAPDAEAAPARPARVWAVRSSHAPADVWPASFGGPIAVIADVDVGDARWNSRWRRGRPDRRGRHGPRW